MKIAVCASTEKPSDPLSPCIRSSPHFIIQTEPGGGQIVLENPNVSSKSKKGKLAVDELSRQGVTAVITGHVGKHSFDRLVEKGIAIYQGQEASVEENIKKFKDNQLVCIENPAPCHGNGLLLEGEKWSMKKDRLASVGHEEFTHTDSIPQWEEL